MKSMQQKDIFSKSYITLDQGDYGGGPGSRGIDIGD